MLHLYIAKFLPTYKTDLFFELLLHNTNMITGEYVVQTFDTPLSCLSDHHG